MSVIHAIVLGLTQGITEFLPISSSGHLVLVRWLLGWHDYQNAQLAKTFDVALHLGTLLAVMVYFRAEMWKLIKALPGVTSAEKRKSGDTRFALALLLTAVPGGILGAAFDNAIEDHLSKPVLIAIMLILFAFVLMVADHMHGERPETEFGYRDALAIGFAQAVALQPGISRSGMTITAERGLGYSREAAARISFLMSIPIIGGAVAFKTLHVIKDGVPHNMYTAFIVGIATSFVSGAIAIAFLLRLIKTHSFTPFVVYRILFGASILVLAATHAR